MKKGENRDAPALAALIRRSLRATRISGVEDARRVRRAWSRALAEEPGRTVLAAARRLVRGGGWDERLVGCELLAGHSGAFALLDDRAVESLATGLADWGSIDLFGVTVAGPAWRRGLVTGARVRAWTRSRHRWRRRLALVATVALNSRSRGGTGDARRTLDVCRRLAAVRDDMVVKALSWALRELAKRDPASVRRFLAEEGERLAARVRREVGSKLDTGLKNRPRASRARISRVPARRKR